MRLERSILIEALETALGPADLQGEKAPEVHLEATAEGIFLSGQTFEGGGWEFIPSSSPLEGAFSLPGRLLLMTLREIRAEHVELSFGEQNLLLQAESYEANLWARQEESQRRYRQTEEEALRLAMTENLIGQLAARVAYARPKGRNKSVFPGVHFLVGPEGLKIVATDGRRLALAETGDAYCPEAMELVLPGRFLLLSQKYLKENEPTHLVLGASQLELLQGNKGITGTLLAEPMPSYKPLLPGPQMYQGLFHRERVVEAVRQARLFSSRVRLQIDESKLFLTTPKTQEGMAEIQVGVEWNGPVYRAQHNTEELLEALESLPGKELFVEFQGRHLPLVLRAHDGTLATLMPLLW